MLPRSDKSCQGELATEQDGLAYDIVIKGQTKDYLCKSPNCGKTFKYKSEIERHIFTHTNSRLFVCQYDNCFKSFKRICALECHVHGCHSHETPFSCDFSDCEKKFTTRGGLKLHRLQHERARREESLVSIQSSPIQARKQVKLNIPSDNLINTRHEVQPNAVNSMLNIVTTGYTNKAQEKTIMTNDRVIKGAHKTENFQKLNQVVEENRILRLKLTTTIKSMNTQINKVFETAHQQIKTGPENSEFKMLAAFKEALL